MRKFVSVFAVFAFVLALAAFAAAEEKKAEPMKAPEASAPAKAAPAKAAEPAKKMAVKKAPKAHQLTGIVEAVDAAAGTLTVKGKKSSVSLKAGEKVPLDKIAVGDKVLVLYSGDIASSVKKVPAKKMAKKTMKKATAPAAPAMPAEPAKPAAPTAPAEKK